MAGMEVAVIGSGGREHVLADMIGTSENVDRVYALPGNPGIDALPKGESVPSISAMDIDGIVRHAKEKEVGLVVVGPESPLIAGLGDVLRANGILTVGPSKKAAQFEGSKIFSHYFNERHGIPQPDGDPVTDPKKAIVYVEEHEPGTYVVKGDGEGGGKAVLVTKDKDEAREFVQELLDGGFGGSGSLGILFQECLPIEAPEVSQYWAIDKNGNKLNLGAAQDHKRVGEGDTGLNGGGSGAYSDVPLSLYSADHRRQSETHTQTFIEGAIEDGVNYEGFLFEGLMIANNVPNRLEYNIRFGDPEAQVVLPRWQRAGLDFHELFMAMAEGRLDQVALPRLTGSAALTICLMAPDYPNGSSKGEEIIGLEEDYGDDVMIYHGGTMRGDDGKLYTNGGRIAYVGAHGDDLLDAKTKALTVIENIHFKGMKIRTDIGDRALRAS